MAKNSFEALLETLPEDLEFEFKGPVRKAMEALAEKVPKVKDSVLAQSDYSRKMDELRDRVAEADEWRKWSEDNWDRDAGKTKADIANHQRIAELQQELESARKAAAAGGDEMTFDQLKDQLEQYSKERGIITKAELDKVVADKEKDLQKYMQGNSGTLFDGAMVTSELNLRHFKEFGEPFDSTAFVKAAVEKNRFDLRDYYEKDFVVAKRQEKIAADHKAELDRLAKERDDALKAVSDEKERQKTLTMGNGGIADSTSPDLGPLQRRMFGESSDGGDKAPDVPLGTGGLSSWAARRDEAKAAASRTA